MNQLIDFYKNVLDFANLHIDDNNYVRSNGGEKAIITVQNRFLVLPVRDHLRNLGSDKEVFHPLAENTMEPMSEVLKTYIYRLNGCLNTRFAETVWELKKFCSSPKKQLTLSPNQLRIIRNVQGEEETKEDNSFERFLAQQITKNPSAAFLSVSMGRGAVFKGQKKSRVGFVTFPLYTKIKADLEKPRKESEFEGMTKKNLELMLQLYEAIFPSLEIPEEYGYGFTSGVAPWFTTLMHTAENVADALNIVTEAFEADFASDDLKPLNLYWKPILDSQDEMQRLSRSAPNTESEPVVEAPIVTSRRSFQNPQPVQLPPPTPAVLNVPFIGGGPVSAYPTIQQPTGFARPESQQKGRARVPFDQWKNQSAAPSPLGATGAIMEAIRRYNEGYSQFYMGHLQQWGVAPGGMPDPRTIPPNVPAPVYPGAPPLPIIPGVTAPLHQQGFGQPGQQQMWMQPGQQQSVPNFVATPQGWMPAQPQQTPQGNWGQTWSQPQQQQYQPQYQQPNYGNQNFSNVPNTHTGTVFPGAI